MHRLVLMGLFFSPPLFLGEHICCLHRHFLARLCYPTHGNLFGGAEGCWGGSVPPFGCTGLRASCSAGLRIPLFPPCASVVVFMRVCALPWQLTGASSGLQLFPYGVCMCLLAFPCLSIPVHISIHYNNPLSHSGFSARDLNFASMACRYCAHVAAVRGAEGQS